MPPSHPFVMGRLLVIGMFTAPSIRLNLNLNLKFTDKFNFLFFLFRQYYIYITDPRCKRVGTQCWVYGAIMCSEAILCIKNGKELFERTQAENIILWLLIQLILAFGFVYGCILWHKYIEV